MNDEELSAVSGSEILPQNNQIFVEGNDYSQQLDDIYNALVCISDGISDLNARPLVDLSQTEQMLGQIKGEISIGFGTSDVPETYYNDVSNSLICICFLISMIFGICVFLTFHKGLRG